MNTSFTENYYQTTDLALAAVLSLTFPLDSVDKTNPAKAHFIYKRSEGLDQLIEAYWKQEIKVEPQLYFQSLKVLKNRLYSSA